MIPISQSTCAKLLRELDPSMKSKPCAVWRIVFPAVAALAWGGGALAQTDARLEGGRGEIEKRIQGRGAGVGIAFRTLDGKVEWDVRGDEAFHGGSAMES